MTVLVTTHNMKEAEYLCGRIAFLERGENSDDGNSGVPKTDGSNRRSDKDRIQRKDSGRRIASR